MQPSPPRAGRSHSACMCVCARVHVCVCVCAHVIGETLGCNGGHGFTRSWVAPAVRGGTRQLGESHRAPGSPVLARSYNHTHLHTHAHAHTATTLVAATRSRSVQSRHALRTHWDLRCLWRAETAAQRHLLAGAHARCVGTRHLLPLAPGLLGCSVSDCIFAIRCVPLHAIERTAANEAVVPEATSAPPAASSPGCFKHTARIVLGCHSMRSPAWSAWRTLHSAAHPLAPPAAAPWRPPLCLQAACSSVGSSKRCIKGNGRCARSSGQRARGGERCVKGGEQCVKGGKQCARGTAVSNCQRRGEGRGCTAWLQTMFMRGETGQHLTTQGPRQRWWPLLHHRVLTQEENQAVVELLPERSTPRESHSQGGCITARTRPPHCWMRFNPLLHAASESKPHLGPNSATWLRGVAVCCKDVFHTAAEFTCGSGRTT